MRLLVEIVIIGALIFSGWDTPFKEWTNWANTAMQTFLHSGRQTPSGVITTPVFIAPRQGEGILKSVTTRKSPPVR
jgi:hypothetical protein